jgi:hypothetical protein
VTIPCKMSNCQCGRKRVLARIGSLIHKFVARADLLFDR